MLIGVIITFGDNRWFKWHNYATKLATGIEGLCSSDVCQREYFKCVYFKEKISFVCSHHIKAI